MPRALALPGPGGALALLPRVGCWALLGGALLTGLGALQEILGTGPYLGPANQALLLLSGAWLLHLAAGGRAGAGAWSAWGLAVGVHGLLWLGLRARGVLAPGWQGLLALQAPLILAAAGGGLALWLMHRRLWLSRGLLPAVAFLLVGLGLALLTRVGAELGPARPGQALAGLAWRQTIWFGLGLAAMIGAAAWASRGRLAWLARKKYLLPLLAAAALILTWLVGPEINGRRLWLSLGQFNLQTVELVKLLMVLFVAAYFSWEHPYLVDGRAQGPLAGSLSVAGPLALMHGLPLLALGVQRDFGPAVLIYAFFLLMLYLGLGRPWPVLGGLGALLAAGLAGYWLQVPAMLHFRVQAWLEPFTASEQLSRGLWAIAQGGLWGAGWGLGHPHTVPLAYSDFAFAVLAEQTGLAGGVLLLACFALLAWRGTAIALAATDPLDRLLAAGITAMITLQALLVLGGVSGLIPLAGLTLPFVSYGGSSLVVNLAMLGLLMRIASRGQTG